MSYAIWSGQQGAYPSPGPLKEPHLARSIRVCRLAFDLWSDILIRLSRPGARIDDALSALFLSSSRLPISPQTAAVNTQHDSLSCPSRDSSLFISVLGQHHLLSHSHPIAVEAGRAAEPRKVYGVVFSIAKAVAYG